MSSGWGTISSWRLVAKAASRPAAARRRRALAYAEYGGRKESGSASPLFPLDTAEERLPGFITGVADNLPVCEQRHPSAHGRALASALEPAPHVREPVDIDLVQPAHLDPGIDGHVRNGIVAGQTLVLRQPPVEHAVQAQRLVAVALDRVGDTLGRIAQEVPALAEHRPQASHLEIQPLEHPVARRALPGQEAAAALGQVLQDGPGLEQRELAARPVPVDDGGDLVVGADG